ncbi:hypothetical protein PQE75_gp193 [Bacillus phage vB_BcoS-136]|uniref:HD domain-containing protein n=1 Tax=Bacillus phage vB_BcoS-136 TaxID=2419619 RepID=A0A3G3BW20_9CAUD|nr:hypothetical protein PQE75_gp193 [Bacillus phage vB_BcoS-136]AYP68286.1 hypothetical protein vBBcoS136_00172 [Bacillus phage vB_BcoS-136]
MLVTYSGLHFDYNNITKESINVDDIIHSLVGINRFNGHSSRPYSVGEHTFYCLLMAEKLGLSARERLLVFIHDFTEAYVGDCPAPLKHLLPTFQEIEARVETAIYEHLGIEPPTEEEYTMIKGIDLTMLVIEMKDLTLHEWVNFINEYTHIGFLKDSDFDLNVLNIDRSYLIHTLKSLLNHLLEEVENEKI